MKESKVSDFCDSCESEVESEFFIAGLCSACWNDLDSLRWRLLHIHNERTRQTPKPPPTSTP
jgi:hypothetical protein